MTDCTRVPTLEEIYESKDAMDDIQSFTYDNAPSFIDAKGVTRDTVNGRIKKMGYTVPVAYASGIVFTTNDNVKTVDESGIIYAPLPSSLPFTTTNFTADAAKFFVVHGVTNDQLINDLSQSYELKTALEYSNSTDVLPVGKTVNTAEFSTGNGGGGIYSVIAGVLSANGQDIIANNTTNQSIVLMVREGFNIKQMGAIEGTDILPLWDRFMFLASVNGVLANVSGANNYLTSDYIPIQYSGVKLAFTGGSFIELTQSSSVGGVLLVFDPSGANLISNVVIYNPQIDGGNRGYPNDDAYGENGVGGTKCDNVKVFGGTVRRCRRGASNQVGTGGKGIQFENGVSNILVDGTQVEDCTIAMETGGVVDLGSIPPTSNKRSATLVRYTNIKAVRCERVITLQQTDSPPNNEVSVNAFVIDGVDAYNCGREIPVGTETDFGPVIVDRAANWKIVGLRIFNEASYGAVSSAIKTRRAANGECEIYLGGDCDIIVSHTMPIGAGTTGLLENNIFTVRHEGTSNLAVEGLSGDSGNISDNLYYITTDIVTVELVGTNAQSYNSFYKFLSGSKGNTLEGDATGILIYGNTYPTGVKAYGGNVFIRDLLFTSGAGSSQVIRTFGDNDLVMQRFGSDRLTLTNTGVRLSSIPTSSVGLVAGDIWNNSGTLSIV